MNSTGKAKHRILVVDDQADMLTWMQMTLERAGYEVQSATRGTTAEEMARTWDPDAIVLDLVLPDIDGLELLKRVKRDLPLTEVLLVTGHGSVPRAVDAMKAGAYSFVEKPVDPATLLATLERAIERRRLQLENRQLRRELDGRFAFGDIIGKSGGLQQLVALLKRIAHTDANVLIVGESGSGKELVANALHANSGRASSPFVKINCASLPSELIESELFGHRKGAFTGAVRDHEGLLKAAHGGSLLLDEIGEMPAHLQTRLLRVLQDREYRPVGASRTERADFRLISATNVDLDAALAGGKLREDLYFRINTITVHVPPLRERAEDIPLLCEHFLETYQERHQRQISGIAPVAYHALLRHGWPGNVRELQHVIERAVLVAEHDEIGIGDLPEGVREPCAEGSQAGALPVLSLDALERMAITEALRRTNGNKQEAAHVLGVYRQTLYSKMKKHGMGKPASSSGPEGRRSRERPES